MVFMIVQRAVLADKLPTLSAVKDGWLVMMMFSILTTSTALLPLLHSFTSYTYWLIFYSENDKIELK